MFGQGRILSFAELHAAKPAVGSAVMPAANAWTATRSLI
jgi:hypothetical protein